MEDDCFGSHLEGMSSGVVDRSCSAPNSDGSAKAGQGSDEESNYKESDIDRQRKVLPVARALGKRRSWFHCACRVRLSYLRPSPFLLAISSTETLFAYAGEGGREE